MLIHHYLELAQPYLEKYGYATIFGGVLVEGFGMPAPGQSLIIAGALLASEGQFNIMVLLIVAWSAAVIGDNIGYGIGHFGARRLLSGKKSRFTALSGRLAYVQKFFTRYGGGIVLFARFFEILRQLNGVVAGLSGMGWWQFFNYNAVGAALWVGIWGLGVYFFGLQMEAMLVQFKRIEPFAIVTGLAALTFLLFFIFARRKINRKRKKEQY